MSGDGILLLSHWKVGVAEFEHGQNRMVSFESVFFQGGDGSHVLLEPPDARDLADQLESLNVAQLADVAKALRQASINAELSIFTVPRIQ